MISTYHRGPILLHCYFPFELEHLFQGARLEVEELFGDFAPSKFANHSPEIICLAKVINEPLARERAA